MEYLQKVKIKKSGNKQLCKIADAILCDEIEYLVKTLRKKRIVHINSTPVGGGVAEILSSLVPFTESFGIKTDWYAFKAPQEFFNVTRKMHDLLQGEGGPLSDAEKNIYLKVNKNLAREVAKIPSDILFIHDPQPLPLASFLPKEKRVQPLISVLHIDLSTPHKKTLAFIKDYLKVYDNIIVSLPDYLDNDFFAEKRRIVPPAIDPVSPKNLPLDTKRASLIVKTLGVNPKKPILLHVLRFDPWKDPFGTVQLHRLLKKRHPNLQTVILGFQLAQDDATAKNVYEEVLKITNGLKDLYLFFDIKQAKGFDVNEIVSAFLTTATVVEHKSIREGFGLVVTEAMWKNKPVVGGHVGGIQLQIENGINGYLVTHIMEAEKIINKLLKDPDKRISIGLAAHERVRKYFLLPRLLRDYLKIATDLIRTDRLFI